MVNIMDLVRPTPASMQQMMMERGLQQGGPRVGLRPPMQSSPVMQMAAAQREPVIEPKPGARMEAQSRSSVEDAFQHLLSQRAADRQNDRNMQWMSFFSKLASTKSPTLLGALGEGADALTETTGKQAQSNKLLERAELEDRLKYEMWNKEQEMKERGLTSEEKLNEAKAKALVSGRGSGATLQAFNMFKEEHPELDDITIWGMVKSGLGTNRTIDPQTGKVVLMAGTAPAAQELKTAEARGTAFGKDLGEKDAAFNALKASMPQLEDTVTKLREVGAGATYTKAGQAVNEGYRQLGLPVPEGAVKRAEYISLVDNQILPLLRQTFGAQFTQKEGESLKVTLGDPNLSDAEKEAVLLSFINTKKQTLESLGRETGKNTKTTSETPSAPKGTFAKTPPSSALEEARRRGLIK